MRRIGNEASSWREQPSISLVDCQLRFNIKMTQYWARVSTKQDGPVPKHVKDVRKEGRLVEVQTGVLVRWYLDRRRADSGSIWWSY